MEILIISGLSGGGKSKAASFLEDMGFYIVDNMPSGMILKFAEFCSGGSARYSKVALVYDVRTADSFDEFLEVLSTLRKREYDCKLLFLEADVVINSTTYSTARLRGELLRIFGGSRSVAEMQVSLESFGFKHGLPLEADLVFDVRFMPNPFYIDSMKHKTGLDPEVRDYVFSFRETEQFMEKLRELLGFVLPLYREEGKTVLVVAIGCTGGHHRSVAVTRALAEYIRSLGYQVTENHRDMTRS